MSMKPLKVLVAPFTTLAIAIAVAGCPNNTTPPTPSSTPKSPKPLSSASAAAPTTSPTPSSSSSTNPTASPSSNATTLPSGSPSTAATPSTTPSGSAVPSATPSAGTTPTPTPAATTAASSQYVQVERLARPAINEGLIRDNALLNLWNSVGPEVDATAAAKPIADHATVTLQALGNTTEQSQTLFTQLLPDVMRIDTTRTSGYAASFGQATLDNLSTTKKIPIGGRMITDDVMDVTLFLIVPTVTANAVANLRSDGVAYKGIHKDVLTEFPYLPVPN